MKKLCPFTRLPCLKERCMLWRPKGTYEAGDINDYCGVGRPGTIYSYEVQKEKA